MDSSESSLRILHVLRAPVGGLFRHVMDVAREQAARGHAVGIIADSATGGEKAVRQLAQLEPSLSLGVKRFQMRREPHATDIGVIALVYREVLRLKPDIIHGHGSKGGFYTRALGYMPFLKRAARAYTPHGGSFHRQPGHWLYIAVERMVESKTDLLLFESDFIARQYAEAVGETRALRRVAKNGLRREEFSPVAAAPDAADFLYIGELSCFKGVDTLIEALAAIHAAGETKPRLAVVGSGHEYERLAALVAHHGLIRHVAFYGALDAREAFTLGRIVVAPSRAESLPYVAMEAVAAGKTIIATDVGGLSEIFGPCRDRLIPRDDPAALAGAMLCALGKDEAAVAAEHAVLARHVAENFNVDVMVESGLAAYRECLSLCQNVAAVVAQAAT
jgi:glycosyltransferase involved in cell wall biosynthesis